MGDGDAIQRLSPSSMQSVSGSSSTADSGSIGRYRIFVWVYPEESLHTYHFVDTLTELDKKLCEENQVDEFSYFFANGAPIKKEDYQNILRDNDEIWALDVDPSFVRFFTHT